MRALHLVPLLLVVAGCGVEFTPRSVVFDTRVLAIEATPLEVGPTDSVTLTAFRVGPAGGSIESERWSFCPFSIGSSAGYACAVPECELGVPLTQPPLVTDYGFSAPLTATPKDLADQCLALLAGSGAIPPDVPAAFPDVLEVLFRYTVKATGGPERAAVQRVPWHTKVPPTDPNLAPDIVSVRIGGATWQVDPDTAVATTTDPLPTLLPGGTLDVLATVTGAQNYSEGGRDLTEQLVVSFYTTAGRFDFDWANGPDASVKLKHEETAGATSAQVWVVVRDLRGGQKVGGPMTVTVAQ